MLSYILEKTKCMFIMSVKPFIKIGKCMVHGSGVQILGRGQGGHIMKLKWFYMVFFTIINCCHVHNILMLDSKIPRPYGRRWGVREGKGGGLWPYFEYAFLFTVIAVCHPLTILTSSWKPHGKLSLSNIELNMCLF